MRNEGMGDCVSVDQQKKGTFVILQSETQSVLTLIMRALVLLRKKSMFVSQISGILTSISQINEPIPGMFGLF